MTSEYKYNVVLFWCGEFRFYNSFCVFITTDTVPPVPFCRDRVRPSHRSARPPTRDTSQRFPSRDRSVSRDRSLSRDRSWSQDRLSQRERSTSRDRPSSAPNSSRLSDWSSRNKNRYPNPRNRTPSPSPAGM